jgi:hypothetical protein
MSQTNAKADDAQTARDFLDAYVGEARDNLERLRHLVEALAARPRPTWSHGGSMAYVADLLRQAVGHLEGVK